MQASLSEVKHISAYLDHFLLEVVRQRETLNWSEILQRIENIVNHPHDIAFAVLLVEAVERIESLLHLHQSLMNTLVESHTALQHVVEGTMVEDSPDLSERNFFADIRHLTESIERLTTEVARHQEALDWNHVLLIVGDARRHPRNIELAIQVAQV